MKMSRVRFVRQVKAFAPAEFDGVSAIGIMFIRGLYGIKEPRDAVIAKLQVCGLDEKQLVEKRDASAFLDALQQFEEDGFLRKTENRYDSITYQIVGEALNAATEEAGLPRLSFTDKAVVRYYKPNRGPKAGTVESDTPGVADTIQALMELEKDIVRTSDIGSCLNRIMSKHGDNLSVSRNGNAYFLPMNPGQREMAENMQRFIHMLSGSNSCMLLPVAGAKAENKKSIFAALNEEVECILRGIDTNMAEIIRLIQTPDTKRPESRIANLFDKIREDTERVNAYCDLLGMQKETLTDKLATKKAALIAAASI
jgi:hypothetical protein